jgi:hypothetical protein
MTAPDPGAFPSADPRGNLSPPGYRADPRRRLNLTRSPLDTRWAGATETPCPQTEK